MWSMLVSFLNNACAIFSECALVGSSSTQADGFGVRQSPNLAHNYESFCIAMRLSGMRTYKQRNKMPLPPENYIVSKA